MMNNFGNAAPLAESPYSQLDCAAIVESLPAELLQLIFGYLDTSSLQNAALTSKCLNRHATDLLWHTVTLVDRRVKRIDDEVAIDRAFEVEDDHDDWPIIEKLYILATNALLASKVQVLNHRCHLPTPNIFNELPNQNFNAECLSLDRRTLAILKIAARNLVNVHTLHIIYGHYNVTRTLLGAFLDPNRPRRAPLRRLWLENCAMAGFEKFIQTPLQADYATGLESLRIRRYRAEPVDDDEQSKLRFTGFRIARDGLRRRLHNASGGWLWAAVEESRGHSRPTLPALEVLEARAAVLDDLTWNDIPHAQVLVPGEPLLVPTTRTGSPNPMVFLIQQSAATLTSLNLDWLLWRQFDKNAEHRQIDPPGDGPTRRTLQALARLRFPNLRAFQVRNAVVRETELPIDVYLLEDMFLDFMEAHRKLQCLAWPLDRFYSHVKPSSELQARTQAIVHRLGGTLTDLRLDSYYLNDGETMTDKSRHVEDVQERDRRRRFILEFAPYMRKVESLKIEGGLPRDEKREIVRALHGSSIQKLVLIGVTFPIGNTWGFNGHELKKLDPGQTTDAAGNLEEEDLQCILASHKQAVPTALNYTFRPSYGWQSELPFLQTIALHHASTITELKICGFNGSPILSNQSSITSPLLYPLRHFTNLRQVVMSLWLLTYFEGAYRDPDIIQSWKDTRSPHSTALAVVTPPASPSIEVDPNPWRLIAHLTNPEPMNRWALALQTRFTPSALASRVARDIGPHLSPVAKARPGGVRVCASFCLGDKDFPQQANDIFVLDMSVGVGEQVLQFVGPREEAEAGRFREKLGERGWF